MTARCGCPDDENSHVDGGWRDPVVFGGCRSCPPESVHAPTIQAELDRLEREDPAVQAAAASLDAVRERILDGLPSPAVKAIYDLTQSPPDTHPDHSDPVLRDRYDLDDDERRL